MRLASAATTAALVTAELDTDLDILGAVERGTPPAFRTWTIPHHAVVVGIGVRVESEVNASECRDLDIPIVRRRSGGRSVVIGPGTIQYSFALPRKLSPEVDSIDGTKTYCNRQLIAALSELVDEARLAADPSGDLILNDRKVAGLALKRRRRAVLVHGTLLVDADIALIERVLRLPLHQPVYRRGRGHRDFLANLGTVDATSLEALVRASLIHVG